MALIEDTIVADIIEEFEAAKRTGVTDTQAYSLAAVAVGVSAADVKYHVKDLRSTVKIAQMKIRAQAAKITEKILEKAPTGELIDILSRPNIGVLEPAARGAQGSGGFILSVAMDSCGGVRASAAMLPDVQMPALPEPQDLITIGDRVNEETLPAGPARTSRDSKRSDTGAIKDRLARARAACAVAESQGPQPDERREVLRRLQGADEAAHSRTLGAKRSKIHLREDHEAFGQST